ncbi:MAG: NifB/NifX family molybdenum-iron cluster-binding protein [Coriobacteriia bacterium]|jgi:predicted Fe-Mo cluster-binding NifX family protein|nr:NifB/NifX family molybdenum-iron cluster-binding protein [Coriobacteriia bacterium]
MKIAISAHGPAINDRVDERFGRAIYLLIVDSETGSVEPLDNSINREALQAAGLGAAEIASGHGVGAVITGHLGPKAYRALRIAGIGGYKGTGLTVAEAVERFRAGTLEALDEGEAHAGMA